MPSWAAFLRDEGSAIGAHKPCNIWPDRPAASEKFKGPEHCIVIERPALHHNSFSELFRLTDLDHFEKRVLDHRIGEPRRYFPYASPFLLGLLNPGVHEDGAARPKVHRALCG